MLDIYFTETYKSEQTLRIYKSMNMAELLSHWCDKSFFNRTEISSEIMEVLNGT